MENLLRRVFKFMNKTFMVPIFRLGLGSYIGNPFTGYIMILKTIGRKSGLVRYTPVNYAIWRGNVYCMAGFGERTDWYQNLQANSHLEIILPGRSLAGIAEDASGSEEFNQIIRRILKNGGFAGFFAGFNPYRISEAEFQDKVKDYPLVRIRPIGVGSGAYDAGGWFWILCFVVTVLIVWLIIH